MTPISDVLLHWLLFYVICVIIAIVLCIIKYKVDKSMSYRQKLEHLTYKGKYIISNLEILFVPLLNIWSILYDSGWIIYCILYNRLRSEKVKTNSKIKSFLIRLILGKDK